MPKPKSGESESAFVSRCMAHSDMQKYDQDQRAAICYSKYREAKKMAPIDVITKSLLEIEKAEEGDKKMIFGKSFKFQGGEWVQQGDDVQQDDVPDDLDPTLEELAGEVDEDHSAAVESAVEFVVANPEEAYQIHGDVSPEEAGYDYESWEDMPEDEFREAMYEMAMEFDDEALKTVGEEDRGPFMTPEQEQAKEERTQQQKQAVQNIRDDISGLESSEIRDYVNELNLDKSDKKKIQREIRMMEEAKDFKGEDWEGSRLQDSHERAIASAIWTATGLKEIAEGEKSVDKSFIKYRNIIRKNLAGVQDPLVQHGVTSTEDEHSHSYEVDADGNGSTTGMVGVSAVPHDHGISNFAVSEAQGHSHELI